MTLVFLAFDVEVLLTNPRAVILSQIDLGALVEMFVLLGVLVVGVVLRGARERTGGCGPRTEPRSNSRPPDAGKRLDGSCSRRTGDRKLPPPIPAESPHPVRHHDCVRQRDCSGDRQQATHDF